MTEETNNAADGLDTWAIESKEKCDKICDEAGPEVKHTWEILKKEVYQEVEKNKADYDEVLQKVERLKGRLKERDIDAIRAFRNG